MSLPSTEQDIAGTVYPFKCDNPRCGKIINKTFYDGILKSEYIARNYTGNCPKCGGEYRFYDKDDIEFTKTGQINVNIDNIKLDDTKLDEISKKVTDIDALLKEQANKTVEKVKKRQEEKANKKQEEEKKKQEEDIHVDYKRLYRRPARTVDNIVRTRYIDKSYNMAKRYLVEYPKKGIRSEIRGIVLYGPSGTGKGITMEIIENDPDFKIYNNFGFNSQIHEFTSDMKDTSEKIDKVFKSADILAKSSGKRTIVFFDDMENVLGKRKGTSVQTKIARTSSFLQHLGGKLDMPAVFLILATNLPGEVDFAFKNRFKWCGYGYFDKSDRINFLKMCYCNNDKLNYEELVSITGDYWEGRTFQQLSEYLKFESTEDNTNDGVTKLSQERASKLLVDFKVEYETEEKERDLATEEDDRYHYNERDITPLREKRLLERMSDDDKLYVLTTGKYRGLTIEQVVNLDLSHLDWIANLKQKLHPDHMTVTYAINGQQ